MMSNENILVACETGVFTFEGERIYIHEGVTRVRAGHPILEGREHLFKPIDVHYDVEDTRARPASGARKSAKKDDE
jgi:hypothetical protein